MKKLLLLAIKPKSIDTVSVMDTIVYIVTLEHTLASITQTDTPETEYHIDYTYSFVGSTPRYLTAFPEKGSRISRTLTDCKFDENGKLTNRSQCVRETIENHCQISVYSRQEGWMNEDFSCAR